MSGPISSVINQKIEDTSSQSSVSLEALVLLINNERLKYLKDSSASEFKELHERQDKVRKLHRILKELNAMTSEKGELDIGKNPDAQKLIEEAKELGVSSLDGKNKYNKDERDRLVDNIKMTIEDLNVQNDMQLQTISRLTNERYETYQMARSILKPLHEDKQNKARSAAGR